MTCLIIAGILFIQTSQHLIAVEDISKVHLNENENRIEFHFEHTSWDWIGGETIESLVECLKEAES